MSKLTRSEKNTIIINESKGIQHPDYYVCYTKKGGVQVRKRKTPLTVKEVEVKVEAKDEPKVEAKADEDNRNANSVSSSPNDYYESVTNKQLLEKMLSILEKNVECKDKSLNAPEKERVTEENKQYAEGVKAEIEKQSSEGEVRKPVQKQRQLPIIPQRRKGRNLLC